MNNKKTNTISTFDRIMKNPKRKKNFEQGYKNFILSEILCELMEINHISVRKLAQKSKISPTIIQELRSGKKRNVTINSVNNIFSSLNCKLIIRNKNKEYTLNSL